MRSIFCIKDINTGTWCESSKFAHFSHDISNAAIYVNSKNAEKTIRDIYKRFKWSSRWVIDDEHLTINDDEELRKEYPQLEVIRFNMQEVK